MRPIWLAVLGVGFAVPGWAQQPTIQSAPLPPLQQQWQQEGSPPVQQGPTGGTGQDQAAVPPGDQPPPPAVAAPTTMQVPNIWLPAGTARLEALDKVDAQATALTVKVGQSVTYGSLTITVKACVVRPTDQPGDAAAFLDVTDSHPDSQGFSGWMLADEPSVSMMQNPVYDLRVTGCT